LADSLRVAILAGLSEPVGPESRSLEAVLAFEIASAFKQTAREIGGISVDLVARRGSWRGLPLLSLDPDEVPSADSRASQEALYTQFILADMLRDYDVIHCLAPLVATIQILLSRGSAVLQTWTVPKSDPAAELIPALARHARWRCSALKPQHGYDGPVVIAPCIDLSRFTVLEIHEPKYVLWLGDGGRELRVARAIARRLTLPLLTKIECAERDLQGAAVFLDLPANPGPIPPLWALRALACGVPVGGWQQSGLSEVIDSPEAGAVVPAGEWRQLADRLRDIAAPSPLRRQIVLRRYSRRAMVARYMAEYRSLLV